ncbi:hypothetical protein, partial [Pseudomonas viridiflava]|uniref:hypothetical protein n=1 Tax=Pseudomonas viridiflava TaxID=33069 RepID=UPI000F061789
LVFKSVKSKGVDLRVESALERDVGILLDIDPRVIELTGQPFTIELQSNEVLSSRADYRARAGVKARFYTPDFLCRLDDGTALAIDAKHSSFIEKFDSRRESITLGLRQHGINFLIVPETAISSIVMETVSSLHLLRAGFLQQWVADAGLELNELLIEQQTRTALALSARLTTGRTGVMAGLVSGVLRADLSRPLFSSCSELHAGFGDLTHLQLLELSA